MALSAFRSVYLPYRLQLHADDRNAVRSEAHRRAYPDKLRILAKPTVA